MYQKMLLLSPYLLAKYLTISLFSQYSVTFYFPKPKEEAMIH